MCYKTGQIINSQHKKLSYAVLARQVTLQIRRVLKTGIGFSRCYPLDARAVFRVLEYLINQKKG